MNLANSKIIILVIFVLCFSVQCFAETFVFTAIPDQNTARLQERFDKVARYLEAELKVPVKYVPVKSYSASVAAFANNEVQMAWFGGLSGVQARLAVQNSQAIAQGKEDQQFVTYIIANTKSGLDYSDDFPLGIAGKTFTFGSKGSTSGRLMPEFFIRKHFDKSPADVFRRVGFSGDHSKTIALVQSGSYEIGAVNFSVWDQEMQEGLIDSDKVKVIWKTPEYLDYNWTIRGDVGKHFGEGFINRVQSALLNLTDSDILAAFPRSSFIKADNKLYKPILETGREVGIIPK